MRHELARQRNKEVADRVAAGEEVFDLAQEYGLVPAYVRSIAIRAGVAVNAHRLSSRRLAIIRELYDLGLMNGVARELLGVSKSSFARYCKRLGVKFPNDTRNTAGPARKRAAKMAAMYRAGMTLQEIGEKHGISRERVRQLMTKHEGMRQAGGGRAAKARMNSQRKKAAQDQRYLEKYGCTFAQYREVRDFGKRMMADGAGMYRTPIYAFLSQRNNAKYRGIEWNLTLWQWWSIWQESGKWAERGKRRDGYVMSRLKDQGAYEIGNVYIGTLSENSSVQPNNPYRHDHPDFARAMQAKRERRNAGARAVA
jgi:hypothetical protein